jgi:hypothetical protein
MALDLTGVFSANLQSATEAHGLIARNIGVFRVVPWLFMKVGA